MERLVPINRGGDLWPALRLGLLLRGSDFGIWPVSAYGSMRALVGDSKECMELMQAETRLQTHSHSVPRTMLQAVPVETIGRTDDTRDPVVRCRSA